MCGRRSGYITLADPGERGGFWSAWRALRAEPRCAVVFTLRADFHGAFMESPLWHGRLSYLGVGPLRGEALCQAIVNPARDVGVHLEPELVERLLADAGSEPGVLPLLQETLGQLWDHRHGQTLTLADYQALGKGDRSGLAVALARRADAVLRPLTPAQEAIARRILLRLISFGEGRSDTRRQQPRAKLRAGGDDAADFDRVLHQLIAARLLTADDDEQGREACVDLAHEVLITSWPTLASSPASPCGICWCHGRDRAPGILAGRLTILPSCGSDFSVLSAWKVHLLCDVLGPNGYGSGRGVSTAPVRG